MNAFSNFYQSLALTGGLLFGSCGGPVRTESEELPPSIETSRLANFDLEALLSRCLSPGKRREELLIKNNNPNLNNFFRAYNYLILNGEQEIEEPCFAGVGFTMELVGPQFFLNFGRKAHYQLTAGVHDERRYLSVEMNFGQVSLLLFDFETDGRAEVRRILPPGYNIFQPDAYRELVDYFCREYVGS